MDPATWVLVGEVDGHAIGYVFTPGDFTFYADLDQPLSAIAYSLRPDDLQLALGPLQITEDGRELLSTGIAEIYTSGPSEGAREWTPGGPTFFVEELDPRACFALSKCRPEGRTFSHCESTCGPMNLAQPESPHPFPVGAPEIEPCDGGLHPFTSGCARLGPECQQDWPTDLPPDAIRVDNIVSLREAIETASTGATIACRGSFDSADPILIRTPLLLRGTCVEGASLPEVVIRSQGVGLRALNIARLVVQPGGMVDVAESRIGDLANAGFAKVLGSVVLEVATLQGATTISDSLVTETSSCGDGAITFERTVLLGAGMVSTECTSVLTDVTASGVAWLASKGTAHLYRTSFGGSLAMRDATLELRESFAGSINASGGTTVLSNTVVEGEGVDAVIDLQRSPAVLTDVSITSNGGGIKLTDTETTMTRVVIRSGGIGLVHEARAEQQMLNATDIDVSGRIGLDLAAYADVSEAKIAGETVALDASHAASVINLTDVSLSSRDLGIAASTVPQIDVQNFAISAETAVFVDGVAEKLTFRRGSIDAPTVLRHEGARIHDFFIQTTFTSVP